MAFKVHDSFAVYSGADIIEPPVSASRRWPAAAPHPSGVGKLLNGYAERSAEMADRFEKALGLKADTRRRMQLSYDLLKRGRGSSRLR